jgi:excisionase family DNA binding protein
MEDDVYTFAYYLLGDDSLAVEATGDAFARVARSGQKLGSSIRGQIFHEVFCRCRKMFIPVSGAAAGDDLTQRLQHVTLEARSAAVLVDVLDLTYEEAASVLGCSKKQIARLLASARMALFQSGETLH